jgi:phage shock protein E
MKKQKYLIMSLLFLAGIFIILNSCTLKEQPSPAISSIMTPPSSLSTANRAITTPPDNTPILQDLSVQAAFDLIQRNQLNPRFFILDVRTPEEFASGHIANAVNLNWNGPDFNSQVVTLDKNGRYLVYCKAGIRSAKAAKAMSSLGFQEIYNFSGGTDAWIKEGFPVVKEE